ncbi:MAG TPA: hypothetical protein VK644_02925 [Chitinophagaceae bacterium]|nr:hypothetical protein [Chitinophagaceae bacterium]
MAKGKTLGILLAGAAAYGLYRYSKMTAEQKKELMKKGKDFMDKNLGDLGNMFGKKTAKAGK